MIIGGTNGRKITSLGSWTGVACRLITKIDDAFNCIEISTRLCPLQILGRQATSTAFKARSWLRILSLECDDGLAREKCRSLPTDMGVESGLWLLWLLPDWAGEGGRCFPESTPFDHHLRTSFDHQIQAISKCYLSRSTYQEDETESLSIYAVCIPGTYGYIVYSDTYMHAYIHARMGFSIEKHVEID